ncbi:MAG: hypothetical protein GPJ52_02260 [Candidatus Heimdallarchaeota archaeon]|nr:hypothetical protein [Candidatus Heimdallarchaeota archaeon]MCG3253165.1 hypothetical protein [Candidatus Heimdallarchaeota archaeon]MCK4290302.1 hypothetical protein [Candidatus Heimdallarchaeota archaeon]
MFKKISKFISYLIVLGIQVAYNLFVIWGLHMWDYASPWISHRTTIILLSLPTIITFNVLFLILTGIAFAILVSKDKKEEEKKGFEKVPDKVKNWFKGESKEEKEFKIPEKIINEIKKEWNKEMAKKDKE